jgi:hypothetical protein
MALEDTIAVELVATCSRSRVSTARSPPIMCWPRDPGSTLPICAADLRRTRDYVVNLKDRDFERRRIFWRGDRIEWLLARGFHAWFFDEIRQDRVAWPGLPLPAPLQRGAAHDVRSAQSA